MGISEYFSTQYRTIAPIQDNLLYLEQFRLQDSCIVDRICAYLRMAITPVYPSSTFSLTLSEMRAASCQRQYQLSRGGLTTKVQALEQPQAC
ncbi:hypothetical protein AVEN_121896-1 [Araneus ventricosus]|uniref:Uncharacterized protein n=1 Tax=Araneus ventricosus TaxID=182803 RepID=A0A4Y2VKI2_ARAVE|nr:hypothetical protein AVEN_121896-1 [Araneus ventricosus]